jgi:two-component system, OmpR family, sensor histidine kinase NblS
VVNIVEKHHARIHIDSVVGEGTTFWFDLPAYEDTCELPPYEEVAS